MCARGGTLCRVRGGGGGGVKPLLGPTSGLHAPSWATPSRGLQTHPHAHNPIRRSHAADDDKLTMMKYLDRAGDRAVVPKNGAHGGARGAKLPSDAARWAPPNQTTGTPVRPGRASADPYRAVAIMTDDKTPLPGVPAERSTPYLARLPFAPARVGGTCMPCTVWAFFRLPTWRDHSASLHFTSFHHVDYF